MLVDICMVLWNRFVKRYFATSGLVFALTWVCIVLMILALSGFAHWYFLSSSSAFSNSVQSDTAKNGKETGSTKLAPKASPDRITATPVVKPALLPTVPPVVVAVRPVSTPVPTAPPSSSAPPSSGYNFIPGNPDVVFPVTNGTHNGNDKQVPTPAVTATAVPSPSTVPVITPTPVVSPTPILTPTSVPTATPVVGPTPISTPDSVPIPTISPDPVPVPTIPPSPEVIPALLLTPTSISLPATLTTIPIAPVMPTFIPTSNPGSTDTNKGG